MAPRFAFLLHSSWNLTRNGLAQVPALLGVLLFWMTVMVQLLPSVGVAQGGRERIGVDIVNLKNHKQIRGTVLNPQGADDVQIAVHRNWLKKFDRELHDTLDKETKTEELVAWQTLLKRTEAWRPTGNHAGMDFFMIKEKERIERLVQAKEQVQKEQLEEANGPQFFIIKVKRPLVANAIFATDPNRRIGMWAWAENLEKVESRSVSELTKELKNKQVDTSASPPDLSDRFAIAPESESHWEMRLAILSQLLGESIEFQGTGDVMIQVGSGHEAPDMASLVGQTMQSQVTSLIEELSGPPKRAGRASIQSSTWFKSAISKAEKIGAKYFRATSVGMDLQSQNATVESAFAVKLPKEGWKIVWQATGDESADNQSEENLERLKKDPQIEAISTQMNAIAGFGESLDKALRFGAATMAAQQSVNEQFQLFSNKYSKQLDSPRMIESTR